MDLDFSFGGGGGARGMVSGSLFEREGERADETRALIKEISNSQSLPQFSARWLRWSVQFVYM